MQEISLIVADTQRQELLAKACQKGARHARRQYGGRQRINITHCTCKATNGWQTDRNGEAPGLSPAIICNFNKIRTRKFAYPPSVPSIGAASTSYNQISFSIFHFLK